MAQDHDESVEDIDDETKQDDVEEDDLDLEDEEEEEDEGGEDDEEEEDGEDDKPLTRKDLQEFRKGVQKDINDRFAKKRHQKKSAYQPPKQVRPGKDEKPWEKDIRSLKESERKRQFGYEHSLSPDEVDIVFKFERKPNKDTLKNPFVVGGLKELRASKNADANIPSGSTAKSVKIGGKTWDELKPEEKQKNFQTRREAILKAKGRR